MRLQVLVGGPEGLAAAGTRIRYRRLIPALARLGIQLTITPMDRLGGDPASEADVLLFSKITDARSLVLAGQLKGSGPLVGIDLFDDYFSQSDRSALSGQRRWLSAIAADLDFALCSTAAMATAVRPALAEVPLHLLADPIGEPVPAATWLAARQQRSLERASAHLSVLWFGMGDNPHFAVGLEDLAAQADHLQALMSEGRRLSLTVLTNPRALGAGGLRRLAALPLEAQVEEWSETLETQRLREADVAFLPVRRDPFSIAKSPNRVLSALLQGCQVLCPGRPDQGNLAPFTYNHGADLARDLEGGSLRWGPHSRAALAERLASTADPAQEALGLQTFLAGLRPRGRTGEPGGPLVVVVGSAIEPARLTALGRLRCLIVASPVAPRQLQGDLWFEACNGIPGALVGLSPRLLDQLPAERRGALLAAGADALPGGRWRFPMLHLAELLAPGGGGAQHAAVLQLALQAGSLPEKAVCIAAAQDLCRWLIHGLLPEARLISAEPQAELLP
jgi:hypothetical protein